MSRRLACIVALVLAAAPGVAHATPSDVATNVSEQVMSPFCPGLTLHDCPSDAAVALRERIESWARAGWTQDQIIERLETEYGPSIAAAPDARGAGLLAWLLPLAGLAAGSAIAVGAARRWRSTAETGVSRAASPSSDERARLDSELARVRGRQ